MHATYIKTNNKNWRELLNKIPAILTQVEVEQEETFNFYVKIRELSENEMNEVAQEKVTEKLTVRITLFADVSMVTIARKVFSHPSDVITARKFNTAKDFLLNG